MEIFEKMSLGKETVALRLYALPMEYTSGTVFHVDVVYVENEHKNYVESMGFYYNYFNDKNQYEGLSIKANMYSDDTVPSQFSLHIDTKRHNDITLERAMAMVKTLKPIQRKLLKLDGELGEAGSFEEYVCRIAKILKVKAFYHTSHTSSTDRTEYRNDNACHLRQTIKGMIAHNTKMLSVA